MVRGLCPLMNLPPKSLGAIAAVPGSVRRHGSMTGVLHCTYLRSDVRSMPNAEIRSMTHTTSLFATHRGTRADVATYREVGAHRLESHGLRLVDTTATHDNSSSSVSSEGSGSVWTCTRSENGACPPILMMNFSICRMSCVSATI